MKISYGELVTIVLQGDYGKPRPALVIQSDEFSEIPSLTVLPLTTDLCDALLLRITVKPSKKTGLRYTSQIMVDKASTVPRSKIGERMGQVDADTLIAVKRALRTFLGLAF